MSGGSDAERLRRLRTTISRLPQPIADVFTLHVGGLDYPAIAAQLAIDAVEVERLLAQALVALDRALEEGGEG